MKCLLFIIYVFSVTNIIHDDVLVKTDIQSIQLEAVFVAWQEKTLNFNP